MDATPAATPGGPAFNITAIPPGSPAAQSVRVSAAVAAHQLTAAQLATPTTYGTGRYEYEVTYNHLGRLGVVLVRGDSESQVAEQYRQQHPGVNLGRVWRTAAPQTFSVEELVAPWQHPWGVVVRYEEPADRPNVIDLVFDSGNRTAETRGARYRWDGNCWDLADIQAT